MTLKTKIEQLFGKKNTEEASGKPQNSNNQSALGDTETKPNGDEQTSHPKDAEQEQKGKSALALYNLIILDESGSMGGVTRETVSGCNETLNGIRTVAKEDKETKQFVSIYCFDTAKARYLFKNAPIGEIRDLTLEGTIDPMQAHLCMMPLALP